MNKTSPLPRFKYKIRHLQHYGPPTAPDLSDTIAILAANVEDAYITCGIENYTAEQCFAHAIAILPLYPKFSEELVVSWPHDQHKNP